MIELSEARKIAKDFIIDASGVRDSFRLEEVYLDETNKIWKVTYSFFQKINPLNQLQFALGLEERRVYRTVEVDSKKGEVIGMRAWSGDKVEAR
jgi:hypothetical protein